MRGVGEGCRGGVPGRGAGFRGGVLGRGAGCRRGVLGRGAGCWGGVRPLSVPCRSASFRNVAVPFRGAGRQLPWGCRCDRGARAASEMLVCCGLTRGPSGKLALPETPQDSTPAAPGPGREMLVRVKPSPSPQTELSWREGHSAGAGALRGGCLALRCSSPGRTPKSGDSHPGPSHSSPPQPACRTSALQGPLSFAELSSASSAPSTPVLGP